jgi:hypothetical protein
MAAHVKLGAGHIQDDASFTAGQQIREGQTAIASWKGECGEVVLSQKL